MSIREYVYFCEKCSSEFSDFCDWADVANYKPPCSICNTNKDVYRDFGAERVSGDTGPRTVGGLADKQAAKGLKNDSQKEERNKEASYKVKNGRAERI